MTEIADLMTHIELINRQMKLRYINAHLHALIVYDNETAKDLYNKNENEINEIEAKISGGHYD